MKKKIFLLFKLIIGLGLLSLLFYRIPISDTIQIITKASLAHVILAFFLGLLGYFICARRLELFISAKSPALSFGKIARAYYIGIFFNNFMPTSIGGDLFKINELRANRVNIRDISAAVIVERISGFFVLFLIAIFFAMPGINIFQKLGMSLPHKFLYALVFIILSGLAAFYYFWKKKLKLFLKTRHIGSLSSKLYRVIESFYIYKDRPGIFCYSMFYSLLFHLLRAGVLLALVYSVGTYLNFFFILGVLPVIVTVSLLPASIGGLGLREGAITFCFVKLGLSAPEALSVALLFRGLTYVYSFIGGILYVLKR